MMKKVFLQILFASISIVLIAQNPIVPPGVYIADPSAHVWADGKLYIYGSLDESTRYYCSWQHHVMETFDLKNWKITENVFSSKGGNDQVSYTDALLFAPDCIEKNGTYYMYYCMPDPQAAEGVATGNSPTGPFTSGKKMELTGIEEIDPCVFVDDDGQAYYIWGQFQAKIAKLKPNMTEIDTATIVVGVVNEKEHFFHEGGYMVKRNGIYYFIYADMSRSNRPTCIGYATAKSPFGPFTYGGVIVDNSNCDPANWNNHGSIAEFNGKWYVFYHRATHNSRMMRKTCIEPITFNADGSINEVEMTSQGAGPALNALETIDAARACLLFGNVRIELNQPGNEILTKIENDDNAAYKYLDFKGGAKKVEFRVKALKNGGHIAIRIGQPWGKQIGRVEVPGTENDDWQSIIADIEETTGIQSVWLSFYGSQSGMFEVDAFRFIQ